MFPGLKQARAQAWPDGSVEQPRPPRCPSHQGSWGPRGPPGCVRGPDAPLRPGSKPVCAKGLINEKPPSSTAQEAQAAMCSHPQPIVGHMAPLPRAAETGFRAQAAICAAGPALRT